MKLILSEKGKDFNGKPLDEFNTKGFQYVLYNKKIYITGNRKHWHVELYNVYREFVYTVPCKSIRLIKYSNK